MTIFKSALTIVTLNLGKQGQHLISDFFTFNDKITNIVLYIIMHIDVQYWRLKFQIDILKIGILKDESVKCQKCL